MSVTVYTASRQRLVLERQIHAGGEGTIHTLRGRTDQVAKIYAAQPRAWYQHKLEWMVNNPPEEPEPIAGHAAIAWPKELLYSERRQFVGFIMPHIRNAVPLLRVFNPRLRAQTLPAFTWKYLHRAARNLAAALHAAHSRGYIVGDLSESNVLVTPQALITLIDTDSFQVKVQQHSQTIVYPCPVGKVEYMAPELQAGQSRHAVRTPEHDAFALAVIIFQLLLEGSHPFRARWRGSGEPPTMAEKIGNGWFPHAPSSNALLVPPADVSLDRLHPSLADLMRRCFVEGHALPQRRPLPAEWAQALNEAERAIVECERKHLYSNHLSQCPHCQRQSAESLPAAATASVSVFPVRVSVKPTSSILQRRLAAVRSASAPIVCPQCNQINDATATACQRCGRDLSNRRSCLNCNYPVHSVAFSPDGTLLAAGCEDGAVQLWNVADGTPAARFAGHTEAVESVVFSSDGMFLASGSSDGSVRLWWVADGTPVKTFTEHVGAVKSVALSADGTVLASGGWDAKVRLWQINDGALLKTLRGHTDWILDLAFSPDGALLASASRDSKVRVWRVATGTPLCVLTRHTSAVESVAFSYDGTLLASGGWDKTVYVWRIPESTLLTAFANHSGVVCSVAFSPDSTILASGDFAGGVQVWQVGNSMPIKSFEGHTQPVQSVAFSPDGKTLASGSKDRTVHLGQVESDGGA